MLLLVGALPAFFLETDPPPEWPASRGDVAPRTRLGLEPTTSETRARIRRRARIDLNRAEVPRLIQLPGVGRTTARRIVETRERRGGYRRVEDLRDVRGIGARTLARLRPKVRVDGDSANSGRDPGRSVALNQADEADLRDLPGIGEVLAERIVRRRRREGPYRSLDELKAIRGIGPGILSELRGRLSIDTDPRGP